MKIAAKAMHHPMDEKKEKPSIYVPIDPAWQEKLQPGTVVTFKVKGKVKPLTVAEKGSAYPSNECCLELEDVTLAGEGGSDEYADMMEDD